MSSPPPVRVATTVTVAGGYGSSTLHLAGVIRRVRIIPPGAGAYKAHIEDEYDGVFAVPSDSSDMDGTTSVEIPRGEVAGTVKVFITDTLLTGDFTVHLWGNLRVYP